MCLSKNDCCKGLVFLKKKRFRKCNFKQFFLNKKGVLYLISFTLWMAELLEWKCEIDSLLHCIGLKNLTYLMIRKQFLLTIFSSFTAFKETLEIQIRPLITMLTWRCRFSSPPEGLLHVALQYQATCYHFLAKLREQCCLHHEAGCIHWLRDLNIMKIVEI